MMKDLLNARLKQGKHSSKMAALAKRSAEGNLTSFTGIFNVAELTPRERVLLENILLQYGDDKQEIAADLLSLASITSEVKAISNQAALFHGERIKKAQEILMRYRDGAFTSWLIATYGNRQTPYNFLQYYEFYTSLPQPLRPQIEAMPRQAVYTLASRQGALSKKQRIVEQYNGQTKGELLNLIRELFPLDNEDGRAQNLGETTIQTLKRMVQALSKRPKGQRLSAYQKTTIQSLLEELQEVIK
jgi:hypothetical protein